MSCSSHGLLQSGSVQGWDWEQGCTTVPVPDSWEVMSQMLGTSYLSSTFNLEQSQPVSGIACTLKCCVAGTRMTYNSPNLKFPLFTLNCEDNTEMMLRSGDAKVQLYHA